MILVFYSHYKCDQIGPFLKDHGYKFSNKNEFNIWSFWGLFLFQHLVTLATINAHNIGHQFVSF